MAFYEHVFLARQDVSGQRVDELVEQYKGVIEAGGGSVGKTEYWGLNGKRAVVSVRRASTESGFPCLRSRRRLQAFPAGPVPPEASTGLRAEAVVKGKAEIGMSLYEHVFLARQDVSGQRVDELVEQYKGVIEAGGGSVGKTEYWGLKSLAFRIKKNRKAHYTLMNIDAPHTAVAEMERQMGINEDILRFLTVRVEELEEEPSVQMQKKERDERRRRDRERRRDDDEE